MHMADCKIVTCTQCNGYGFAKPGERFAKTRICRRCVEGWTQLDASIELSPKSMDTNPYGVAPGQVWESLDPRERGRTVEVLEIDETHAVVLSDGARHRRIKLTSFTRTKGRGYRRTDKEEPRVA